MSVCVCKWVYVYGVCQFMWMCVCQHMCVVSISICECALCMSVCVVYECVSVYVSMCYVWVCMVCVYVVCVRKWVCVCGMCQYMWVCGVYEYVCQYMWVCVLCMSVSVYVSVCVEYVCVMCVWVWMFVSEYVCVVCVWVWESMYVCMCEYMWVDVVYECLSVRVYERERRRKREGCVYVCVGDQCKALLSLSKFSPTELLSPPPAWVT